MGNGRGYGLLEETLGWQDDLLVAARQACRLFFGYEEGRPCHHQRDSSAHVDHLIPKRDISIHSDCRLGRGRLSLCS
jgi:hypothetical protein